VFSPLGYDNDNCFKSKHACVTLHLPPPEIFTFCKSLAVFSKIITSASALALAALIAAKNQLLLLQLQQFSLAIIGLNKFCEDAKVSVFVANIQILGLLRFISKKEPAK